MATKKESQIGTLCSNGTHELAHLLCLFHQKIAKMGGEKQGYGIYFGRKSVSHGTNEQNCMSPLSNNFNQQE